MHRVVVVGSSGSGKTTVARKIATALDVPHLELDSVFHQRGWRPMPDDEFQARVADFAIQHRWVIDGNYTSHGMQDLLWPVADTLVWLDLPRWLVMSRVVRRTVKRAVTREVLWNENREPMTNFYRLDPEKNIIRWAWTRYRHVREKYEEAVAEPSAVHLKTYRLRSAEEVAEFLKMVQGQSE